MTIKIEDIYEAFKISYRLLIKRLAFFIPLTLVFVVISQIANLIATRLESGDTFLPMVTPKSFIIRLIGDAITLTLIIGLIRISLRTLRGEKVEIPMLFDSSDRFLKVLAGGFLVICMISALPLLCAAMIRALSIPPAIASIIMIAVIIAALIRAERLRFWIYFIVEKDSNPFEAIRESSRITNGNIKVLLLFDILCILLNMLGAMVFLVGILITFPLTAIAKAHLYKKLSDNYIEETIDADDKGSDSQVSND